MFKAIRVAVLLFILAFVAIGTWLAQARSTDWNNSLWVKVYPINADGSETVDRYIATLELDDFADIEAFLSRETTRYGRTVDRPLRMELGRLLEAEGKSEEAIKVYEAVSKRTEDGRFVEKAKQRLEILGVKADDGAASSE